MKTATKRLYRFQIVIEKEPEADYFTAYAPSLSGCFRRGSTLDEAREEVREAMRQRLQSLLAAGQAVEKREKFLQVEELTIEVDE